MEEINSMCAVCSVVCVLGIPSHMNSKVFGHNYMNYYHEVFFLSFFQNYLFLERGEGREKKKERNIDWLSLTHIHPTEDQVHNPGMFSEWEWNPQPFSL